jgi:hypothetical protein
LGLPPENKVYSSTLFHITYMESAKQIEDLYHTVAPNLHSDLCSSQMLGLGLVFNLY